MIDILYYPDDITLLYSFFPLLTGRRRKEFRFENDPERMLRKRGSTVILFRFYKRLDGKFDPAGYIARLREHFDRIVYFDDTADPREINSQLIGLVDNYYKKQLLRDRSAYARDVYGKRVFAEYYHERHGVSDSNPAIAPALAGKDIEKLRLSWNLGIGSYPKSRIRKAAALRLSAARMEQFLRYLYACPVTGRTDIDRMPKASARFGSSFDRETVAMHRTLFVEETRKRPDLFLTGRIPLKEYNRELKTAAATVSPFGWGEICFRDFEAIINRSVLLKPSMEHIETWPGYLPAR